MSGVACFATAICVQPCTDLTGAAATGPAVHSPFGDSDDEAGTDDGSPLPNMARAAYVPEEWRAWGMHGSTGGQGQSLEAFVSAAAAAVAQCSGYGNGGVNSSDAYNGDAPLSAGFGSYQVRAFC